MERGKNRSRRREKQATASRSRKGPTPQAHHDDAVVGDHKASKATFCKEFIKKIKDDLCLLTAFKTSQIFSLELVYRPLDMLNPVCTNVYKSKVVFTFLLSLKKLDPRHTQGHKHKPRLGHPPGGLGLLERRVEAKARFSDTPQGTKET